MGSEEGREAGGPLEGSVRSRRDQEAPGSPIRNVEQIIIVVIFYCRIFIFVRGKGRASGFLADLLCVLISPRGTAPRASSSLPPGLSLQVQIITE